LLFREKWAHHRAIETELELLQLRYRANKIDDEQAISEFERIVKRYGSGVPMAGSTGPTA
jgi:hypothetical protein